MTLIGARPRVSPSAARAIALAVVAAVLATLVLHYPVAVSWWNDYENALVGDRYVQEIQQYSPQQRAELLAAARRYNDELRTGRIPEPFGAPAQEPDAEDPYWRALDGPGHVMARLRMPSIDLDLPVLHGTSDATLERGSGHLQGTALPVGGLGTHAVLTGHRGRPDATLFTRLDEVRPGDRIYLDVLGETFAYEVRSTEVHLPEDTAALRPLPGKDLVTLVTCTPLGINSHRIFVTAERVPLDAASEAARPGAAAPTPWWALTLGGSVLGIVAGAWLLRRRAREPLSEGRA
jgi:sortase A